MWDRSFWLTVLAIFVLALVLRLGYFNLVTDGPLGTIDSPAYESLGDSLRRNQAYTTTQASVLGGFPEDLQRPPGYPAFLALTNPSSGVARQWTAIVQSVLGALFAASLVIFIGWTGNVWVGLLTGLFYACDWVSIFHTPMLLAETVFTVILTAAVFCFACYLLKQRITLAALAGGLLGIAALIKPVAQLVLIAFFLAWAFQAKRRWSGLVFLVLYAVCVLPWMVRNYQRHQVFTVSAISTASLYFYTAQGAVADYHWRELSARNFILNTEWRKKNLSPAVRKQQMEEEAWELIRQHWPMMIKHSVVGFVRACFGTSREALFASFREYHQPAWFWHTGVPLLQILLLWIAACAGVWVSRQNKSFPPALLVLLISTVSLVLLAANGLVANSRFRVPITPILCFLAAIGSFHVLSRFVMSKRPGALLGFQALSENLQHK
jgi:hypothetical protein